MNSILQDLTGSDLDLIIEKSFRELAADQKIEVAIDDFLENLNDWNRN
jgi:hypothetical protein